MSDEEIAVQLAAAILQATIALPNRFANVSAGDQQILLAAQLSVKVYQTVLGVLKEAKPA